MEAQQAASRRVSAVTWTYVKRGLLYVYALRPPFPSLLHFFENMPLQDDFFFFWTSEQYLVMEIMLNMFFVLDEGKAKLGIMAGEESSP